MSDDENEVREAPRKVLDGLLAGLHDALAEHQVTRRVAQQGHLRGHDHVGPLAPALLDRLDQLPDVAGHVADGGVELGDGQPHGGIVGGR